MRKICIFIAFALITACSSSPVVTLVDSPAELDSVCESLGEISSMNKSYKRALSQLRNESEKLGGNYVLADDESCIEIFQDMPRPATAISCTATAYLCSISSNQPNL